MLVILNHYLLRLQQVYLYNTVITVALQRPQCHRRLEFPTGVLAFFSSASHSVKTALLTHTPNELFDQIWRKGVPFGTLGSRHFNTH